MESIEIESDLATLEDKPEPVFCSSIKIEKCDYVQNTPLLEENEAGHLKSEIICFDYKGETTDLTWGNNDTINDEYELQPLKFENIDIKCELGDSCSHLNEQCEETDKKQTSKTDVYKCNECGFHTSKLIYLKKHSLRHKNFGKVGGYKTHGGISLHSNNHPIQHKNDMELRKHKCHQCNFQTNYVNSLKRHFNRHKNLEEIETYQCYQCNYGTTFKSNLITHIQRHSGKEFIYQKPDRKSVLGANCPKCDYKSNVKRNLQRHMICHSKNTVNYTCFDCGHQTKWKNNLEVHIFRQHRLTDENKYKCGVCNFDAVSISDLQIHKLSHKNAKHVRIYKCNDCTYQTIYKNCIDRHNVFHQSPDEIKTYNCFLCNYKAVRKDELRNHILRHSKKSQKK